MSAIESGQESGQSSYGVTRRQWLTFASLAAAAMLGVPRLSNYQREMYIRYGISDPSEWVSSIKARMFGPYEMGEQEDLLVFPDAIVTGDVEHHLFSPLPPAPLVLRVEYFSKLGQILIVDEALRIRAPYGAFVEYRGNISREQFLASKLKAMIGKENCEDGCDGVTVWRFGERDNVASLYQEAFYTREQIKDLGKPAFDLKEV